MKKQDLDALGLRVDDKVVVEFTNEATQEAFGHLVWEVNHVGDGVTRFWCDDPKLVEYPTFFSVGGHKGCEAGALQKVTVSTRANNFDALVDKFAAAEQVHGKGLGDFMHRNFEDTFGKGPR